ncbi:MAG: M48 family metalloprotease, partial [Candidatus Omnitrophica bacterium]|nr:M48 family metalloprotease [Candidatus Omnitrophota bacterium]
MKIFKTYIFTALLIMLCMVVAGCATTYSKVDRAKIQEAEEGLKVKALDYQLTQLRRVNEIWRKLVFSLPYDEKKEPCPDIGIIALDVDVYSQRLFNLPEKKGVVIVYVASDSPGKHAGLKVGDKLEKINDKKIVNTQQCSDKFSKLKPGEGVTLTISRKNEQVTIPITAGEESIDTTPQIEVLTRAIIIGKKPLNAPLNVVDMEEVNAAASPQGVYITYGMLRFTNTDDETAAILAHELAHITKGHLAKHQGASLAGSLICLSLGIVAEVFAPGSGNAVLRGSDAVSQSFQAQYSQDLEREADYYSVYYMHDAGYNMDVCGTIEERLAIEVPKTMISHFLATHPSSPERLVRIKQTI